MKRAALVVAVLASVVLSGVAVASVVAGSRQSSSPTGHGRSDRQEKADDPGIHGGPIDRFHGSDSCGLIGVGALPGNWTHGDYVSAVAVTGDSTMIVEAAHSNCGKPMVSVGNGTHHASIKIEKHASTPAPGS